MNTSDKIRALSNEGLSTATIAKKLGIRYQHAYKVLKADGQKSSASGSGAQTTIASAAHVPHIKPPLSVEILLNGGFVLSGRWLLSATGDIVLDQAMPKTVGVYAFARDGVIMYVGVATMGLAKRLYFYGKPGVTQRTSLRLNGLLKEQLQTLPHIEIYTAAPSDLGWNGLPVHGSAGLELGLIKKYSLPWNMRSAG